MGSIDSCVTWNWDFVLSSFMPIARSCISGRIRPMPRHFYRRHIVWFAAIAKSMLHYGKHETLKSDLRPTFHAVRHTFTCIHEPNNAFQFSLLRDFSFRLGFILCWWNLFGLVREQRTPCHESVEDTGARYAGRHNLWSMIWLRCNHVKTCGKLWRCVLLLGYCATCVCVCGWVAEPNSIDNNDDNIPFRRRILAKEKCKIYSNLSLPEKLGVLHCSQAVCDAFFV